MKIKKLKNFIFSITNEDNQKVITALGLKIKLKNNFIFIEDKLCKVDNELQNLRQELSELKQFQHTQKEHLSNKISAISQSFDLLCQEYYSKAKISTQKFDMQIKAVQEDLTNLKKFSESNFQEIKYHLYPYTYHNDFEKRYIERFIQAANTTDLKESYQALIKGLDDVSINTVNKILSMSFVLLSSQDEYVDIFSNDEKRVIQETKKKFEREIFKLNDNCFAYNKYLLPINHFEMCVFADKHCIDSLNIEYFRNKNIIDAGGFVGDSAIIFSDYTNKNIYSFEPIENNFNLLQKTIELNKTENIIPINCGLAECDCEFELYNCGSASGNFDIDNDENTELCKFTSLDSYVQAHNLEIGLIKTDLEGLEQRFLKGAENTIKQQKPTLLISIYHTCDDFFNIKRIIESWNLGYKFRIVKPIDGQILLETLLIAEIEPLEVKKC